MSHEPNAALVKRSLVALQELRAKYDALRDARTEPIAIVGIGCRFPGGASSPDALWRLLERGVDTITEVPRDRWDSSVEGTIRFGAFLDAPEAFDPYFFGISPREAAQMDPQQRIFLEVAWHALEDAGIRADAIAGTDVGVFVGANCADYLQLQLANPEGLDTYSLVGGTSCIIANRLSYLLDLRGPSVSIDTACSSSLVAVHQACQSLRLGECGVAIAAGMNLLLAPAVSTAHARGLPLAADGRCKTFDARADGYVRGEGCGVVILKRLSQAVADGDRVWAVIRGSAVNQDGLSNGLTAPNGNAQRAVIQKALDVARVRASAIGLVEAHGTGTALGDPIEVECLKETYGVPTDDGSECLLGSIKTNIGHLEAGAGIAGLIKAALAIAHRAIPASLHFTALNPHIALEGTRLRVATALTPWDAEERVAAVSAFGAGGTNAHAILASGPEVASEVRATRDEPALLVCSARSATALAVVAGQLAAFLESDRGKAARFADVCASAALRRTHHAHRGAIVARTHAEAAQKLRAWIASAGTADESGARGQIDGTAAAFIAGEAIDFDAIFGAHSYVSLPLYPFQREPFWFCERARALAAAPKPTAARAEATAPAMDLGGLDERARHERVRALVHAEVARVLRFPPSRLEPAAGFFQLGMDSIMAAQLRNRIEQAFGRKYPVSVILEHPSVDALSAHLARSLSPTAAPKEERRVARTDRSAHAALGDLSHNDIAALLAGELDRTA